MTATSKCSIIILLRYNQNGDVRLRENRTIYFKLIWYRENYLLRHNQFKQSHFSVQFMISIVSKIVCRTFSKFRIPAPCFFYPGSVGCSAMDAVFAGHNHLFLKINVCNFLFKILRIKHHNSSFLINHYKEKTDLYVPQRATSEYF